MPPPNRKLLCNYLRLCRSGALQNCCRAEISRFSLKAFRHRNIYYVHFHSCRRFFYKILISSYYFSYRISHNLNTYILLHFFANIKSFLKKIKKSLCFRVGLRANTKPAIKNLFTFFVQFILISLLFYNF